MPLTTISNSTIANNNYGGIESQTSKTTLFFTTVANHNHIGLKYTRHENHINEVQLTIKGSLIANNTSQNCNDIWSFPNTETNLESNFNASSDQSCGFIGLDALQNIEDPFNGSLSKWGGSTPTLMLNESSPVIDFVSNMSCPDHDQRGRMRPLDGSDNGMKSLDGINGGLLYCDIGALEFDRTTDPLTSDILFENSFEQ